MPQQREEKLISKKNKVFLRERRINGELIRVVEKEFTDPEHYYLEMMIVNELKRGELAVPGTLRATPPGADGAGLIVYEYIEGPTALDYIGNNGLPQGRFVLKEIIRWLAEFYSILKARRKRQWILGDAHLRNFIYNESSGRLYGFDFENACPGRIERDIARLFLFIITYDPAYSGKHLKLAAGLIGGAMNAFSLNAAALRSEIETEAADMCARRNISLDRSLIAAIIEKEITTSVQDR